jgi:hypothetical protein
MNKFIKKRLQELERIQKYDRSINPENILKAKIKLLKIETDFHKQNNNKIN